MNNISWQKAQELLFNQAIPLGTETLQLSEARGRRLAEDVLADRDFPPTNRSAMDGFALRFSDVNKSSISQGLPIVGESSAGLPYSKPIEPASCVRIMTGAIVPEGADTVVRQEDAKEENGKIFLSLKPELGENIRRQGEEARRGQTILRAGSFLSPSRIAICATANMTELKVFKNPRVAVICSGNEISNEKEISPEYLRDTNGPLITKTLQAELAITASHMILPDDQTILRNSLIKALHSNDVVILTGGVSVGKYDLVPSVIKEIGAEIIFHKLSIRPGKPQLYANFAGKHIFGLPGNPLGVLSGLHLLVLPSLRLMTGADAEKSFRLLRLPLFGSIANKRNITEFRLAKLTVSNSGTGAQEIHSHGSADLISSANADGFIIIESARNVADNELVDFLLWRSVYG